MSWLTYHLTPKYFVFMLSPLLQFLYYLRIQPDCENGSVMNQGPDFRLAISIKSGLANFSQNIVKFKHNYLGVVENYFFYYMTIVFGAAFEVRCEICKYSFDWNRVCS